VAPKAGNECRHADTRVGLVDGFDIDGNAGSKDLPLRAVGGNCLDGSERIRGDHRAPPANHVSIIAVVRGLDQDELKTSIRRHWAASRVVQRRSASRNPGRIEERCLKGRL
jgi:hypothetical protein